MWKDYRPASSFSLLRLFFSLRFNLFSSLRLASSASWWRRHLWKFSTTTPTNMLSTKKATMSRKEMKYSSIHGLQFNSGWNRHRHTGCERYSEILFFYFASSKVCLLIYSWSILFQYLMYFIFILKNLTFNQFGCLSDCQLFDLQFIPLSGITCKMSS